MPPNDAVMFYAVLKGTARIAGVGGGMMELNPGDVALILSGEAHALRSRAGSPVRVLDFLRDDRHVDTPPVITVGDSGTAATRVLCGRLRVSWPAGLRRTSMPPVVRIDANMFGPRNAAIRVETLQMSASGSGASALLTRTAALMFTVALRNHPQCPLLFRLSASNDPVAQALQLIASDPAANWTVAGLARKVGMGRSNFAARFALEVGRTPMDVVTERRMHHAVDLLRQGELKIAEIGARVGYRSEAAFSRRFTNIFGLSPGQMRRNARTQKRDGEEDTFFWRTLFGAGQPAAG
jgi:transcriptional regulator GlxA family with amidase domain